METGLSINYIGPFLAINGATSLILSKINEKKIIENFDAKSNVYLKSIKNKYFIPEELKYFVNTLEKNIDKKNLYNLYNNLENVKIKRDISLLAIGIKGRYNAEKNELSYSLKECIEHELMHLASSYYNKDYNLLRSGLIYHDKDITFAKALNEGYTDLITRRLFDKKTKAYDEEVRIVELFELLFDKDKLENYYFNNEITAFINTLSKYVDRSDAIKLIVKFDLGFDLKKQGNILYKIIYKDLEIMICEIFKHFNKDEAKQKKYNDLLEKSHITKMFIYINQKARKKDQII